MSSDSPLDALFDLDVQSWIWDNWWIVLCTATCDDVVPNWTVSQMILSALVPL